MSLSRCGSVKNAVQDLRNRHFLLCPTSKAAPPLANRRNGLWVPHNGRQHLGQRGNVMDVLYCDTSVSVDQSLIIGQLSDEFGRGDQAPSAQQHLARNDRRVKRDRKILFQTAYGHTTAKEFRHAPVG